MVNQRNEVVDSIIFKTGAALRQSSITQHLAVRFFDVAFVRQQEYDKNDLDETVNKVVKETINEVVDARNEPKNLKILAAQCLILASKVMEPKRIYPAEVVYQIRGWNKDEFEMLQDGSVEEYLLNLFDFQLIQLVPASFLQFMLESWNQVKPVKKCCKV